MEKILVINPGSTSTKLAYYEDKQQIFNESIPHSEEDLKPFKRVVDQYEMRKSLVLQWMKEHGLTPASLTCVVSRGGLLTPVRAGAYTINEDMIWQLSYKPLNQHASNVGALIAYGIAQEAGIPAYIYDAVTVDEMDPVNRLTGLPGFYRKGIGHNLNTRAAAIRYAEEHGKNYKDISVIVTHLGGGITVNLHHMGRIIDCVNDEESLFSPERAGGLPTPDVIKACYAGKYGSQEEFLHLLKTGGGLYAHLGTKDSMEVEKRIAAGDEYAELVYKAMAMIVAKNIGKLSVEVCGKLDAVILTGGMARSEIFTKMVVDKVSFLAPCVIYPGENEMEALARGALRVLQGRESARVFVKETDNTK